MAKNIPHPFFQKKILKKDHLGIWKMLKETKSRKTSSFGASKLIWSIHQRGTLDHLYDQAQSAPHHIVKSLEDMFIDFIHIYYWIPDAMSY